MKLFFTFSKKTLGFILSVFVVLFVVIAWYSSLKVSAIDGSTHAKRMEYVRSLKLTVDEENCSSKETVIPSDFGKVYLKYNELQKRVGFDLSRFKGKQVTIYSYPLENTEKNLTLIVYKGEIIGGDIADIKINGEMKPLEQ